MTLCLAAAALRALVHLEGRPTAQQRDDLAAGPG